MARKGLAGIASFAIGGYVLVYVFATLLANAGYKNSTTNFQIEGLENISAISGLIAFLFIGFRSLVDNPRWKSRKKPPPSYNKRRSFSR